MWARHRPDSSGAWGPGTTTSAAERRAHVEGFGALLAPAAPGDELLVICRDRYRFTVALLAAWQRGYSVALPPNHQPDAIRAIRQRPGIVTAVHDVDGIDKGIDVRDSHVVDATRADVGRVPYSAFPDHPPARLLATLDTFRASVAAAAVGLAQRAFDEAVRHALARRQFGRPLSEFQGVQMAIAEMHAELQAARLLVRHAAWTRDQGQERLTLEGSTAKLFATEMAQRVVDRALQIHGGQGVVKGATVERLYREVRALRIYEGTSEIQKLVIAREILKESK